MVVSLVREVSPKSPKNSGLGIILICPGLCIDVQLATGTPQMQRNGTQSSPPPGPHGAASMNISNILLVKSDSESDCINCTHCAMKLQNCCLVP